MLSSQLDGTRGCKDDSSGQKEAFTWHNLTATRSISKRDVRREIWTLTQAF